MRSFTEVLTVLLCDRGGHTLLLI